MFGSRARGDHRPDSDIDVLLWTDGGYPMVQKIGLLALAFYPREHLLQHARAGDLFAGHLACEAQPVWDPTDLLGELRFAYRPSADQGSHIANASDLGAMLIDLHEAFPPELLNKRMAWVVRTVLIARAAQLGEQLFAADELLELLNAHPFRRLIDRKDAPDLDLESLGLFDRFLSDWGSRRPGPRSRNMRGWRRLFDESGNDFAGKTLRQLVEHLEPSDYG